MKREGGKLFLFRSTHDAIRAEQVLIAAGFRPQVVPVPKRISPDCGIAIWIDDDAYPDAHAVLEKDRVKITHTVDASEAKNI